MKHIVPAILVETKEQFAERISNHSIRSLAPLWQVDVLDGSMYEAHSWAEAKLAAELNPLPEIELHLMIQNPLPVIKEWHERIPSLKRAIIHAEIDRPIGTVIDEIEKLNLETGIALNPETPIEDHLKEIDRADVLLILGVHPGKSGQGFLGDAILQKTQEARRRFPEKTIAVDGGVNELTIKQISNSGVDQLCAASAIWGSDNPEAAFTALKELL